MADSNGNNNGFRYYHYDPSIAAASIFGVLFGVVSVLHTYQLVRTRTWIFVPFVIGGVLETVGYIARIISATQTPEWTLLPFLIQTLFLLVAPALLAASIYMTLGRIIQLTDGGALSLIPLRWLTTVFVAGDVLSFFTQGGGGGIMSVGDGKNYDLGESVVLAGLGVQVVVFGFFVVVAAVFHRRLSARPTPRVRGDPSLPWRRHMLVLYGTSGIILVRSLFRMVEFGMGNDGFLLQHEVFLYVLDALLIWVVMVWFAVVHPSEVYALLKGGKTRMVKGVVRVQECRGVGEKDGETDGAELVAQPGAATSQGWHELHDRRAGV